MSRNCQPVVVLPSKNELTVLADRKSAGQQCNDARGSKSIQHRTWGFLLGDERSASNSKPSSRPAMLLLICGRHTSIHNEGSPRRIIARVPGFGITIRVCSEQPYLRCWSPPYCLPVICKRGEGAARFGAVLRGILTFTILATPMRFLFLSGMTSRLSPNRLRSSLCSPTNRSQRHGRFPLPARR